MGNPSFISKYIDRDWGNWSFSQQFLRKNPYYLESFIFLRKLNLSFNDFEGIVPERGIFTNATAASVKGNNMLCRGKVELHLRNYNSGGFKKKRFSLPINSIISIGRADRTNSELEREPKHHLSDF